MANQKYNMYVARVPKQLNQMQELAKRGICAFCPEHIRQETRTPIEIETDSWFVKQNDYPYDHTKLHLLLIPKQHIKTLSELTPAAQAEFLPLISQLEKVYKLTSYAIGIRSGDMRYNGGSVEHLHAHLIVADPGYKGPESVRFRMSQRPPER